MSLIEDGIVIVLSSPSGAGKTTLVKKISKKKKFSNFYILHNKNTQGQWG